MTWLSLALTGLMAGSVPVQLNVRSTDFAFEFVRAAKLGVKSSNGVVSPLSASYALALLANASRPPTVTAALTALGVPSASVSDLTVEHQALLARVDKECVDQFAPQDKPRKDALRIANGVWTFGDFKPKAGFVRSVGRSLRSELACLPSASGAAPEINAWFDRKTAGLIPKMVNRLNDSTVFLLANALAFQGKWASPFKPSPKSTFQTSHGKSLVPMMRRTDQFATVRASGLTAVWLPYTCNCSLVVVMPPFGTTPVQYLAAMNARSWFKLRSLASNERLDLTLPKFSFGSSLDLQPALTKLGAGALFQPGCDFSNLADLPPSLSKVGEARQSTAIDVDEKGTRATAATDISGMLLGVPAGSPIAVKFDRPFIFVLQATSAREIVLVGVVNDPNQHGTVQGA